MSADASDRTGVAVVFSNGTQDTVQSHGGTSASAPIWAALIALADQYAGRHLGFINPAIYQAGLGWDPVTGWGSPNAQVLIPLLARYASPLFRCKVTVRRPPWG